MGSSDGTLRLPGIRFSSRLCNLVLCLGRLAPEETSRTEFVARRHFQDRFRSVAVQLGFVCPRLYPLAANISATQYTTADCKLCCFAGLDCRIRNQFNGQGMG